MDKSDTLPQDYLHDYKNMVNIQIKYVTLNTTYAINGSAIFFCGLPVFLMVTVFPFFVIIDLLIDLIDLHKQLLFIAGKPALSFSDI